MNNSIFQVGDKIKCIDNQKVEHLVVLHQTYTVAKVDDRFGLFISLDGIDKFTFNTQRFLLA